MNNQIQIGKYNLNWDMVGLCYYNDTAKNEELSLMCGHTLNLEKHVIIQWGRMF